MHPLTKMTQNLLQKTLTLKLVEKAKVVAEQRLAEMEKELKRPQIRLPMNPARGK